MASIYSYIHMHSNSKPCRYTFLIYHPFLSENERHVRKHMCPFRSFLVRRCMFFCNLSMIPIPLPGAFAHGTDHQCRATIATRCSRFTCHSLVLSLENNWLDSNTSKNLPKKWNFSTCDAFGKVGPERFFFGLG